MKEMPNFPSEAEILDQDRIKREENNKRIEAAFALKTEKCKMELPSIMNNLFQNLEKMRGGTKD